MSADYRSRLLTAEHDVTRFDCGTPSLNAWLARHALRAQAAGSARTFVWTADDAPATVRAYFSLAPTEVVREALSRGQSSGYSTVPGYLLARLALADDLRGRGLGAALLVDALTRAARAAAVGGGRLVVVDALDDAAAGFYRHHGFTPVKNDPLRLVLKLSTVHSLL